MSTIKELIDRDVALSTFTPDIATLRYRLTPIRVMIWDGNQSYANFTSLLAGLDKPANHFRWHQQVTTKEKVLAWFNNHDSSETYEAYMMDDVADAEFLDIPDEAVAPPDFLGGVVYEVSLQALQELDMYYMNNEEFTRAPIKVKPFQGSSFEYDVYTYVADCDTLGKWDAEAISFKLRDKVDLVPFSKPKGKDYISYTGK